MTDKLNREELLELRGLVESAKGVVSDMEAGHERMRMKKIVQLFDKKIAALLSARQEQAEPTWNEAIEAAQKFVEGRRAGRAPGSELWLEISKISNGIGRLAK